MIDFHCHLDLYPRPHEVAGECQVRNVIVLSVTTTPSAWNGTFALSSGMENIFTALGLHPEIAAQRFAELDLFEEYLPLTRFVGEIGLDGSPELAATWPAQEQAFARILHVCARAGGRFLSIHSRRAVTQVLALLSSQPDAGTAILHWFSGTNHELNRAIDYGCWFSVSPAMLSSQKGRALVAKMPRNRLITETDGPFTQVSNRPCVPWDVERANRMLSEVWSLPLLETEELLKSNLDRLLRTHAVV